MPPPRSRTIQVLYYFHYEYQFCGNDYSYRWCDNEGTKKHDQYPSGNGLYQRLSWTNRLVMGPIPKLKMSTFSRVSLVIVKDTIGLVLAGFGPTPIATRLYNLGTSLVTMRARVGKMETSWHTRDAKLDKMYTWLVNVEARQ